VSPIIPGIALSLSLSPSLSLSLSFSVYRRKQSGTEKERAQTLKGLRGGKNQREDTG
jgi:hypothetical protein